MYRMSRRPAPLRSRKTAPQSEVEDVMHSGMRFAERRLNAWFALIGDLSVARAPADVLNAQGRFWQGAMDDYGLVPEREAGAEAVLVDLPDAARRPAQAEMPRAQAA